MNKTDIHSFSADITFNVNYIKTLPENATVEISGYSFFGKPSENIRNNYYCIGCKLFVTEIELSNCSELSDDIYDNIMEQVEDYVDASYACGMRESQLDISAKYSKIKDVDFEFEQLEGDEFYIEELNEKYKNENWFIPETIINYEKITYAYFRMYHIVKSIEGDFCNFLN